MKGRNIESTENLKLHNLLQMFKCAHTYNGVEETRDNDIRIK